MSEIPYVPADSETGAFDRAYKLMKAGYDALPERNRKRLSLRDVDQLTAHLRYHYIQAEYRRRCAVAGAPALQWTLTPPSEPGWYWIEGEDDPSEVFPMADREELFVCRQDERGDKVFCVVADVQLKWSGPLRPPPIPLPGESE